MEIEREREREWRLRGKERGVWRLRGKERGSED